MRRNLVLGASFIGLGIAGLLFLEAGVGPLSMGSRPGMLGGPWGVPKGGTVFASNGEQIYYTGVSRRTGRLAFQGGPIWLWMHGGGCAVCHGVHGRGGVPVMMGTKIPSDIRYARLIEVHHEDPVEPAHPPYTNTLIRRALTHGVNPSGRELDWTMPRWRISDEDFGDLLAYLKALK